MISRIAATFARALSISRRPARSSRRWRVSSNGSSPTRRETRPHDPGGTMKSLLVLCAFLLSAHAQAGQDWELISITHGAAWEVNQAKGPLQQNGNVLEGVLKDKTDGRADYRIRIELKGGRAEAA